MIKPTAHVEEAKRLAALDSYDIIDTLSESDYNNLTALASEICNTPISLVSLLDNDRQWFKSHHGLQVSQTPKDFAFCAHAINQPTDVFIVQDTREDIRFHDNPLVTGHPNIVFYAGVVLKTADNLPLGTLCVIDNKPNLLTEKQITSLKALSNQVMNLLELRKSKILLEKANNDLVQSNLELEKFAVIAAHDLKSPLNNISSLIDLLDDDYNPNIALEDQSILGLIKHSTNKLKELIDGLLAHSKSSRIVIENKKHVQLETLIRDIQSLYSYNNKCVISLKTNLSEIYVNQIAIEQILINLISNAYRYCDNDVAKIQIEIIDNDEQYEILVKDNGIGILPKYHSSIFETFTRLSNEDRFGNTGNGIGLSTVKKIVELLGGKIKVESNDSQGSVFSFTIKK